MSHRVETFIDGAWANLDGMVFATRSEAAEYIKAMPKSFSHRRIASTDDQPNYHVKDGKLVPGPRKTTSWQDYIGGLYDEVFSEAVDTAVPGGATKIWYEDGKIQSQIIYLAFTDNRAIYGSSGQ